MAYKPPKQTIVDNDLQNTPSSEAVFEALKLKIDEPTISGSTGQLLQLDGYVSGEAVVSWVNPPAGYALPSQTGNAEKVLATDGTSEYWAIEGVKTGYPVNTVILGRAKPASLTGTSNVVIGNAGNALTTGTNNIAIGDLALNTITTNGASVAIGNEAARYNFGPFNTFVGSEAGKQQNGLTGGGARNVGLGYRTLYNLRWGNDNIAIGSSAQSSGSFLNSGNISIGTNSLQVCNAGNNNITVGVNSGIAVTSGNTNILIGNTAGDAITTGSNNVIIGDIAGSAALADTMIFAAGTAERFRVDSSGNMGIGTASPAAKLDVRGSAVFNEDGADVDFRVEGDTDANLVFVDASTDKVGIGTSTPTEKLEVAGAVKADEFTVTRGGGEVYRLDPHTHDEGTETTDFTINWSNGSVHSVTLNAAGPLVITMNNPVDGGAYALRIIQGATPGTVTWPANVKWPGGNPPVLSTNTGDIDVVNLLYYSDTATYYATFALAFA